MNRYSPLLLMVLAMAMTLALTPSYLLAGTDHDHGAPSFQAPKGGIIKSTHTAHFELVTKPGMLSLFVYDDKGSPLETKGFKIKSQLELPRKKATAFSLVDKGTHWEALVDTKGAHRYTLKINIDDGKEKDDVSFTVENR